jgi:hypothetical protein
MRKLIIVIGVIALIVGLWLWMRKGDAGGDEKKQEPIKTKVNSAQVNKSVDEMVVGYINMKNAFVEADTALAKTNTKLFISKIDSLKLDDLKKDSLIYASAQAQVGDIKSNAVAILGEKDITEMRKGFQMVSENLYPFLKTIAYKGQKLYWQNCPMAFGEGKDASWISSSEEIMNPYLGKNHPQWKSGMLHCGETKDSIVQ